MNRVKALVERVVRQVSQVVLGKERETRLILLALLAGRHVLIEDVPGVGKTTLVQALAKSLGCTYSRIQFTPDLLPSDITGINIFDSTTRQFTFQPGPIMSQIVLADEINRASPKTQSALLEAMEEAQISVDGQTYRLPQPFLVLATQNPVEYEGTFPLPESQLDRFAICIGLGYPDPETERRLLSIHAGRRIISELRSVTDPDSLLAAMQLIKQVYVADQVADYMVRIVMATRQHPDVYLGASPRATLNLYELSRAAAAAEGRDYVTPDDIKPLALPVLSHRLILKHEAAWREEGSREVIHSILDRIEVPGLEAVHHRQFGSQ